MADQDGPNVTNRRVTPVGRGDSIVALNVYHADAVASASTIRQLRATVAAQALTIAGQDRVIAEQAAALDRRPRWVVLHAPAWRCEWLGAALATVATWAGAARRWARSRPRPTPVIDALWE